MLLQGKVAAYVASDLANTMTAATVNISARALIDYEAYYKWFRLR